MKLIIQKSGIYVLLLLYCTTLFSFGSQSLSKFNIDFVAEEIDDCSSLELKSIQIYFSEHDTELKVLSENEENSHQKKGLVKQLYIATTDISYRAGQFQAIGIKNILEICFSQAEFNYPFHSFW